MNLLTAIAGCFTAGVSPITIPSNWGVVNLAAATIDTATKTLTVPSGNPGNVRLNLSAAAGGGTPRYVKNGAAAVNITDGMIVSFANGDTLLLRLAFAATAGDTITITATDNTTSVAIGDTVLTRI